MALLRAANRSTARTLLVGCKKVSKSFFNVASTIDHLGSVLRSATLETISANEDRGSGVSSSVIQSNREVIFSAPSSDIELCIEKSIPRIEDKRALKITSTSSGSGFECCLRCRVFNAILKITGRCSLEVDASDVPDIAVSWDLNGARRGRSSLSKGFAGVFEFGGWGGCKTSGAKMYSDIIDSRFVCREGGTAVAINNRDDAGCKHFSDQTADILKHVRSSSSPSMPWETHNVIQTYPFGV